MGDGLHLFKARREFADNRLRQLRTRLADLPEVAKLPGLCVYATGSYARNEAAQYSDIDLFFVHRGSLAEEKVSRLDELRLFAKVIDIGEALDFPTFSNDGEYLRILYLEDMLRMLGGREDDYQNFFTARMLLLLESYSLVNDELYMEMTDSIVEAYFRDYPDHSIDFRPVFLINDVIRFWKTLCLNYEHRRNKPEDDLDKKRKQQVKNFKLKFSRLMTCFGTVVAICAESAPITKERVVELTRDTPLDRFLKTTEGVEGLGELRGSIIEDYAWFMEKTALSTDMLRSRFDHTQERAEMFRRADSFANRVYDVLAFFAERNHYRRFLVV